MPTLDEDLPVWTKKPNSDRLDNNYYSPSFDEAKEKVEELGSLPFNDLIKEIKSGLSPSEDGTTPIIEGKNVYPNVVFPDVRKSTTVSEDSEDLLKENDILVTKDGSPGIFAVCSKPLLNHFHNHIVGSQHLYLIKVKNGCKDLVPFVVVFLNSKIGQSLVRRYITGAISPSIRDKNMKRIPIPDPYPREEIAHEIKDKLEEIQKKMISVVSPVDLSEELFGELGTDDEISTTLPINWMPGGKRDAHGYNRETK